MKETVTPDHLANSRAVANQPATKGVAIPDVTSRPQAQEEASPVAEEALVATPVEVPVILDMNDDEVDEAHTLFIDLDDGILWLHSDKQTLELFLQRKRKKSVVQSSAILLNLLKDIEDAAKLVHIGRYGTVQSTNRVNSKGILKTSQRVAPTVMQRQTAVTQLQLIGGLLQKLNIASAVVMKKQRPPSHKVQVDTKSIDGDPFCAKVIMAPLSLLPRDDGVVGSPPGAASNLFTKLTKRINYKRGHMLNEHLHGPGTGNNLVPISTAFNSVMKTGVEKTAKEAVNANNKVIRFEAEPLDWGLYPGFYNHTFPDEQKLPNKFRFLVRQMTRIPGTDGSDITHWQDGPVLYSKTETHTVPSAADVVQGTVAPVVQTFKPGYYRSHDGKLEQAANLNYHLVGTYTVNNPSFLYFFEAFGLDPATLTSENLPLNVTTEFQLPSGLSLIPIPKGTIEIIINGKVHKVDTPEGESFVIADASTRGNNLAIYAKLVNNAKLAQQQEEQLALKKKQQEQQQRIKSSAEEAKSWKVSQNTHRILKLEMAFNEKAEQYQHLFTSDIFLERFKVLKGDILSNAKALWERDEQLYTGSLEFQLSVVVNELQRKKEQLVLEQSKEAIKARAARDREELVSGLLEDLTQNINEERSALTDRWQVEEFDREADRIFNFYKQYWENPRNRFNKSQRPELLGSALRKIQELRDRAKKVLPSTTPQVKIPAQQTELVKRKFEPLPEKKTDQQENKTEEDSGEGKESERKKLKSGPGAFTPNTNTSGVFNPGQFHPPAFQSEAPRPISIREATETANTVSGLIVNLQQQFDGDPHTQGQLALLHVSIQRFVSRPGNTEWGVVFALLNELKVLAQLSELLKKPIWLWNSIRLR
ncbi:hypothetical protein HGH93_02230 [Chitinophaga polysaccharea]|uniref:hypothetical protein n=1 Tax=Chitinophaga TaxID=79328 RepID=UPI001454ED2B|nr:MULTISPECIES: hypothetical protein [Chitinophaga]NLR56902.1 hypothetical protein [Chitinophaga polysaccharea]NLU93124.1 hypothetical protein [Chitinophaga sp. Ak27]